MGTVIRRASHSAATAFSFADVERQAQDILGRARNEADCILAEAKTRAAQLAATLKKQAQERGWAEGCAQGRAQACAQARQAALEAAQAELSRLIQTLATGLAEYERQRNTLLAQAESGLIELALAIARRVCKSVAAGSTAAVQANIRALLEMVKQHQDLELHVNPADYELLAEAGPQLTRQISQLEHVALKTDPAVDRGGCVLHTRDGAIDATIAGQLDRIAAAIGADG
jgi:flagellar assembly protein FliH